MKRIVFLDWDNTLLSTDYLTQNGIALSDDIPLPIRTKLKILGSIVYRLIINIQKIAHVIIVTNANTLWVKKSAEIFFPIVATLIENIDIVSASEQYGRKYPNEVNRWKYYVFRDILQYENNDRLMLVVGIGDLESDRTNLLDAMECYRNMIPKTIILDNEKDTVKHYVQLNHLLDNFEDVFLKTERIDTKISIL